MICTAGNNQGASFGWNLESSAPPPMSMPMPQPGYPPSTMPYQQPQYPPQYHQTEDNGDSVVDEFHSKDAGAMSFAHYIVNWVSLKISFC